MKILLIISAVLNIGLLGCLMLDQNGKRNHPTRPAVAEVIQTGAPKTGDSAPVSSTATPSVSPPFRWHELDSPDYHVYVKNLRSIGCPGPTLRAIVTGDVDVVYQLYGSRLEKQLSDLENNQSWTNQLGAFNSIQKIKDELQAIPGKETVLIADFLGESIPVQTAPVKRPRPGQNQPPVMPLVLENVDLAALNLSSNQLEVVNHIRQTFTEEIGGLSQDPNDPEYLKRWRQAQPEADAMLRGMLGNSFYQTYQLAAENNSGSGPAKP